MLEADLEDNVVDWAESEGGYALKLKLDNQRGWADRTLFLPDGKIVIAELKKPKRNDGGSINQHKWMSRLVRLGFNAGFCTSLDEVKRLCR